MYAGRNWITQRIGQDAENGYKIIYNCHIALKAGIFYCWMDEKALLVSQDISKLGRPQAIK